MPNSLPSNFGGPGHFCDFKAEWPDQLWDQSRPHTEYRGKALFEVGGSLPESGKGPFSDFQNPCAGGDANGSFWGASFGPQPEGKQM